MLILDLTLTSSGFILVDRSDNAEYWPVPASALGRAGLNSLGCFPRDGLARIWGRANDTSTLMLGSWHFGLMIYYMGISDWSLGMN